jgi:hypothetical protein
MAEYSFTLSGNKFARGFHVQAGLDYRLEGDKHPGSPQGWTCDQRLWCGPEGHGFKNSDSIHNSIDVGTLLVGFSQDFITKFRDRAHMVSVFGPYVGHGLETAKTIQPPYTGFMYFVMNDTLSYADNRGSLKVTIQTASSSNVQAESFKALFGDVPEELPIELEESLAVELTFKQQRHMALIAELGEIGAAYAARFPLSSADADGDRVSVFLDKVCGRLPFAWCKEDNP